eukprot:TRINITY_DN19064_c0_g1_i1.p1 TRINITY_DN19064_c0_g1~~TRINITY_DN19064_c0_g1_i1.p1  ORF type:complete len:252 (+),score=24.89 TRINITY_DN19064_c0_g1_i1:168-923(+)
MSLTAVLLQDSASDDYSDHLEFMEKKVGGLGREKMRLVKPVDDLDTQQPYLNAKMEQLNDNNQNLKIESNQNVQKIDLLTQRKAELRSRFIIGITLCILITSAWISVHIINFFVLSFQNAILLSPILIPIQCWLGAGLFIIGHDAMHGSLAPFRPKINRFVGRFVMMIYAGIWWDDLVPNHFAHHRNPGTDHDPDFAGGNKNIIFWFFSFFPPLFFPLFFYVLLFFSLLFSFAFSCLPFFFFSFLSCIGNF